MECLYVLHMTFFLLFFCPIDFGFTNKNLYHITQFEYYSLLKYYAMLIGIFFYGCIGGDLCFLVERRTCRSSCWGEFIANAVNSQKQLPFRR